jgi:hypothetical protein
MSNKINEGRIRLEMLREKSEGKNVRRKYEGEE